MGCPVWFLYLGKNRKKQNTQISFVDGLDIA